VAPPQNLIPPTAGVSFPHSGQRRSAAELADLDPGFRRRFPIGSRPNNGLEAVWRPGSGVGDVGDRDLPDARQPQQNYNFAWNGTSTKNPVPGRSRGVPEQLCKLGARKAERAEHLTKLARGRGVRVSPLPEWGSSVSSGLDRKNGHFAPVGADGVLVNSGADPRPKDGIGEAEL
jgi:hypothetical protein